MNVEEKLHRAHKTGNYTRKLGYDQLSGNQNNDEDLYMSTTRSAGENSQMSAFEKLLHKDNKKLNRMQDQARNFLKTGGSTYDPEESKISTNSRHSVSSGALPQLNPKGRLGGL